MLKPTAVHDVLKECWPKTAAPIPMFNEPFTDYCDGRTADSNERTGLGHCRHYHMEVKRRQKTRADFFDRTFSLNHYSRTDFHTVGLTVVNDMLKLYSVSIVMSAPLFITACTK